MEISKRFYHDVLGLDVAADFGANVMLDGGIFLQTLDTWEQFIRTNHVILQNNAGEMYFEEEDIAISRNQASISRNLCEIMISALSLLKIFPARLTLYRRSDIIKVKGADKYARVSWFRSYH